LVLFVNYNKQLDCQALRKATSVRGSRRSMLRRQWRQLRPLAAIGLAGPV